MIATAVLLLLLLLLLLLSPKLLLLHAYALLLPLVLVHPLQPVAPLQLLLQLQPRFLRLIRVRGRNASNRQQNELTCCSEICCFSARFRAMCFSVSI